MCFSEIPQRLCLLWPTTTHLTMLTVSLFQRQQFQLKHMHIVPLFADDVARRLLAMAGSAPPTKDNNNGSQCSNSVHCGTSQDTETP